MKKIMKVATGFLMCFLLILSAEVSLAVEASLYDSGSGTTTAPSGVSIFALSSDKYTIDASQTIINLNKFRPFKTIALRLDSIDLPSGVTFGQAADTTDGTVDGDVYQIYARVSNDVNLVSSGQRFLLTPSTKYSSSVSPYLIFWAPPPTSYARIEFLSGVSAVKDANIDFTAYDVEYNVEPIPISHQSADFATTGLTTFVVGLGAAPSGCRCIEIQATSADAAYSAPATSGVSKILIEDMMIQMPINEYNTGSYGPGAGVAGTVNAQYWTDCP